MTADAYQAFLGRKSAAAASTGFDPGPDFMAHLRGPGDTAPKPHQVDVTRWALRRGRAAMFLDTGLGKTLCQLAWADAVTRDPCPGPAGRDDIDGVIILAPLAVAEQTVREAEQWGIPGVGYCRSKSEAHRFRIVVTNYEMLPHFDVSAFAGIVLDESSILKNFTGATRTALIEAFSATPYRLACTATPAPNDFTELGNHAEFLGIKSRAEMLAEYFVHDGGSTQDWRLKGHATQAFFRWLSTWGTFVRKPSDLGHDDDGYDLPPLRMHEHVVAVDHSEARAQGRLFADDATSLADQRSTRRATMDGRIVEAARIVGEADGPAIVWCELNDEADAATAAIPGAVQVSGSDDLEAKRDRLLAFASGQTRCLVTKAAIAGAGLNFQACATQVFVGASHSYERTYQAIRRSWRFGQTRPVDVHVIRAETERTIVENYRRKEQAHREMGEEMAKMMKDAMMDEVRGASREWRQHDAGQAMRLPSWLGGGR